MNEEEMAKRIERLEQEQDTIKLQISRIVKVGEAIEQVLEKWQKNRK